MNTNNQKKSIKQQEIDRSLLILTDTIKRLSGKLNTYTKESASDLFLKMSDARKEIDEIANDARTLFQECLERCIASQAEIPQSSIKWERDEYDNLRQTGSYQNRPPCEVCRETRKVEFCHIIPRQIGGSNRETNIMYLCSTHHSCFDKGVLTKLEWEAIDWRGKSDLVKSFVEEVFFVRQQEHWEEKWVPSDIVYHGYKPLRDWVKKHLGHDSVEAWDRKRRNKFVIRSGGSYLG